MTKKNQTSATNQAPHSVDVPGLAQKAEELGYDTTACVVNRLLRMIVANQDYLSYRQRAGRTGRYNEAVAEDTVVLAKAVQLLEGKGGQ